MDPGRSVAVRPYLLICCSGVIQAAAYYFSIKTIIFSWVMSCMV